MRGKVRYFDTDNSTEYRGLQSADGAVGTPAEQWLGRVLRHAEPDRWQQSGGYAEHRLQRHSAVTTPPRRPWGWRRARGTCLSAPRPTSIARLNSVVSADYRINRTNSLEAAFEREDLPPRVPRTRRDVGKQGSARLRQPRFRDGHPPACRTSTAVVAAATSWPPHWPSSTAFRSDRCRPRPRRTWPRGCATSSSSGDSTWPTAISTS